MKMLKMKPWIYVGIAAFPNIESRETIKTTGLVKRKNDFKVKQF